MNSATMLKGFTESPSENILKERRLPKISDDEEEEEEFKLKLVANNEPQSISKFSFELGANSS